MKINSLTTATIDRIFRAVKWFEKYVLPSGDRLNGQLVGADFVNPDPSAIPNAFFNEASQPTSSAPNGTTTTNLLTGMVRVVTPDWSNASTFPRDSWQRWVCGLGGSTTNTNSQDSRTIVGTFSITVSTPGGNKTLHFDTGILVHVS